MSKLFNNPYHFVPVEAPGAAANHLSLGRDKLRSGEGRQTHERYVPGHHSGRLVVSLTTVTPVVVGSEQDRPRSDDFAGVKPYTVDGVPAVPGSSLRGLVGSVIEAASNGPLRILEDRPFSWRKKMGKSLSALGLITLTPEGRPQLRPMCLPTLDSNDGGNTFIVERRFQSIFPQRPQFKVYFGDARMIRDDQTFLYRTHLNGQAPVPYQVKQLEWAGSTVKLDPTLHVKASRYAVAQIAEARYPARPGRVRVLGCWGKDRINDIPNTKKHEVWLPEPDPKGSVLPITDEALERFKQLCDERTNDEPRFPFEPRDTRPNPNDRGKGKYFRLREGDMVYFDVNAAGQVTEIALSAIWRGRVEEPSSHKAATAHTFFGKVSPALVPLIRPKEGEKNPRPLSVAELMLGFIEENPDTDEKMKQEPSVAQNILALASRLRFHDALPAPEAKDLLMPETTLRILASPKPPCPVMYFRPKDQQRDNYIEKEHLSPVDHLPMGRKWYLHAKVAPNTQPWKTSVLPHEDKSKGQKNKVQPIKAGKTFWFHIDFDNLSTDELGLLIYALQPDASFHHKLGMGKPLGLGSAKLEILGLFEIDRVARYTVAGLKAERYTTAEFTAPGTALKTSGQWPARYALEGNCTPLTTGSILDHARKTMLATDLVPQAIRQALSLLGDYTKAPLAEVMHYPTVSGQPDHESEHFKWFVFNDGHKENRKQMTPRGQSLKPLGADSKALPTLSELEWEDSTGYRGGRW